MQKAISQMHYCYSLPDGDFCKTAGSSLCNAPLHCCASLHSSSTVLPHPPFYSSSTMPFFPSIPRFIDEFKKYPVSLYHRLSSSSFFRPPTPSSWMTYAESTRSAVVYSSIVPPPRTPVGPSMLKDGGGGIRKGSAPPPSQSAAISPQKNGTNSLDFWSKSEDEKSGITCYYSRHNIQFPSQRQISRMKAQPGRPTMNGLTSPPSSSVQNGRFPTAPFPQSSPPPPESVMSPPVGIYRNVPAMPRAKLADKQQSNGRSRQPDENQKNVVWGGSTVRRGDEDVVTPLNPPYHATNEKKRSTARRKPRWARCMQTLFCCVTPPREIEKIQSNQRTNSSTTIQNQHHQNGHSSTNATNGSGAPPIQLITQVNRDGTVTGLPPVVPSVQQNGSGDGQTAYEKIAVEAVPLNEKPLLPPLLPQDSNKKCLVIDLDETLVHSSFKPVKNPDFVIPVEIDGVEHQVYVLKRPYVDEFLAKVGEHFECVLFTASLAKYADPVADLLDKKKVFRSRLFREACVFHKGNYVKDLSRLGRNLNQTLIIDNSPASYAFHPENAVPVTTWFDDPADTELMDILPTLKHLDGFSSIYELYRPEDGPQSELLNHCSC